MMNNRLNKYKYPGAKRLMLEAQELKDNNEDFCAQPIDDNLFEWHFTLRGPPDTAFDGGYYHGRLSFPTEYPMKPPSIILLTPNGRFETNKKICLSISGYHPETWQPSWSVRTALLALIAFMPTKANRAIGSLDFSDSERRRLAARSRTWRCETCGLIKDLLKHPEDANNSNNNSVSPSGSGTGSCTRVEGSPGDVKDISNGKKGCPGDRSDSDGEDRDSSSDSQITNNNSGTSGSDSESNGVDLAAAAAAAITTKLITSPKQQMFDSQTTEAGHKNSQSPSVTRLQEQPKSSSSSHGQDSLASTRGSTLANGNMTTATTNHVPHNLGAMTNNDVRPAYSSFVFRSIFVLLSLLILRRVVMVIQA